MSPLLRPTRSARTAGGLVLPSRQLPATARGLDRRAFLGLGAAGAGALALTACGGPSTSTAGAAASESSAAVDFSGVTPAATIAFWSNHPGGSQEIEQTFVDEYNASQSDTVVTLVTAGANYEEVAQRFQAAQAGTGLPGLVIFSDVWWFRYFLNDSIIPMGPVAEALDIDLTDFQDTLLGDYAYDDQTWALPYARSTPLFYYNKAHWAAAGLPDRAPETWEEMGEWAPALAGAGLGTAKVFQQGAVASYSAWTFNNNAWGWGGSYSDGFDITIDGAETVAAAEWLRQAVNQDGWMGITSNDQGDDLSAGAVSCTVTSTGGLVGIKEAAAFEVGVGFLPGGPEAQSPVCPTGGAGIGIPKDITVEEQLAAANFLKFLTLPANTSRLSEATGYLPSRKSSLTDGSMDAALAATPQLQVAIDQLAVTRSQAAARTFLPGGDKAIADGLARVLVEDQDPQTVFTEVKATLEDIYTTDVEPNL